MSGPVTSAGANELPAIRQDLRLLPGPRGIDGAPQWLVYDPLQHRYVAIGKTAYVLFQIWGEGGDAADLAGLAWQRFGIALEPKDVEHLAGFLLQSGLAVTSPGEGWRFYAAAAERRRRSIPSQLLHNYLFFRIPLFRPERFLRAALPAARLLASRGVLAGIGALGLAGLYLVSREWPQFLATFAHVLSAEGALLMAAAVVVVKLLHELGHAFTAAHYACRVPVIGVAVMLGMPMLYSDVTDAWRLRTRRQRLAIDLAGVAVEIAVACIATFLWAFLPDGPARSIAFSLATAGWIMSLAVNLNPLMRFDGYHVLADLTGIDNLQSRAFALGRWRMREMLFDLRAPPPEPLPPGATAALAGYAWAVWIYRLVLFLGIALVVYHYFFKVLGVVLFLVEVGYFIAGPIAAELKAWWQLREKLVRSRRTAVTAACLLTGLGALAYPWSAEVAVPAVAEMRDVAQVYPPRPARVATVHVAVGQRVEAGDRLVTLASREIEQEITVAGLRLGVVEMRLARRMADEADREEAAVLAQERAALLRRQSGLERERGELELRAAVAGLVVEMDPALAPGRWVGRRDLLVVLRGEGALLAKGYVAESDVWRLDEGRRGVRFVPDDPALPTLRGELLSVSHASAPRIDRVELASLSGGPIATLPDQRQAAVPVAAQYPLRALLQEEGAAGLAGQGRRGVLIVPGRPESIAARLWRQMLKVLVRESGL